MFALRALRALRHLRNLACITRMLTRNAHVLRTYGKEDRDDTARETQ